MKNCAAQQEAPEHGPCTSPKEEEEEEEEEDIATVPKEEEEEGIATVPKEEEEDIASIAKENNSTLESAAALLGSARKRKRLSFSDRSHSS
jgi:hypothetical protein